MKKLLTIIFALSLIMFYTMPAAAIDDIEDNNANAAMLADTQSAIDDGNGNMIDSTEVEVGDVEDNFQNNSNQDNEMMSDNDDSFNYEPETTTITHTETETDTDNSLEIEDSNVQAGICDSPLVQDSENAAAAEDNAMAAGDDLEIDNSNDQEWNNDQEWDIDNSVDNEKEDVVESNSGQIAAKGGEIEDDHSVNNDNEKEDVVESNSGQVASKGGEIDQSTDDNREYDTDVEIEDSFNYEDESKVATLSGNGAAAAFGGMAMAVDITEMRLNLAETTSLNFINQDSGDFDADADADADVDDVETDDRNGGAYGMANAGAAAGLMMQCTTVQNATYGNVGNTLVNVGAGNFNNQAGINSVTATIQY